MAVFLIYFLVIFSIVLAISYFVPWYFGLKSVIKYKYYEPFLEERAPEYHRNPEEK